MLMAKGISLKNKNSINGVVEMGVIGKFAAKNSAANMRTRYNDKINNGNGWKINVGRGPAYFYNKRDVQCADPIA